MQQLPIAHWILRNISSPGRGQIYYAHLAQTRNEKCCYATCSVAHPKWDCLKKTPMWELLLQSGLQRSKEKKDKNSPEVKWGRYGVIRYHQQSCLTFLRNGNFWNCFLDRFSLDEISLSCIDGNRHISTDSPISILARALLTVISKIINRRSYYELLQTDD